MIEQLKSIIVGQKENAERPHDSNWAVFLQRNEKTDKSNYVTSDDESIPPSSTPVVPEDVFLKVNGAACIPCIVPFDEDCVPPYPQSAERSDLKNKSKQLHQNCQTRGEKSKEMMRVFIPPELEPAQRVKVRYPNGTTLRTVVPPRSKWLYKTCNGRIRSFFVVPIPPDIAQKALRPSSQHNHHSRSRPTRDGGRRSTKSIQKVQFFTTPSKH